MTTVELRTLRSGDYIKCISDVESTRGIKKGEIYRVRETGKAKWEHYYYADINRGDGSDFEVYYKNVHLFEIV